MALVCLPSVGNSGTGDIRTMSTFSKCSICNGNTVDGWCTKCVVGTKDTQRVDLVPENEGSKKLSRLAVLAKSGHVESLAYVAVFKDGSTETFVTSDPDRFKLAKMLEESE